MGRCVSDKQKLAQFGGDQLGVLRRAPLNLYYPFIWMPCAEIDGATVCDC